MVVIGTTIVQSVSRDQHVGMVVGLAPMQWKHQIISPQGAQWLPTWRPISTEHNHCFPMCLYQEIKTSREQAHGRRHRTLAACRHRSRSRSLELAASKIVPLPNSLRRHGIAVPKSWVSENYGFTRSFWIPMILGLLYAIRHTKGRSV